jgi:hypothetical protein
VALWEGAEKVDVLFVVTVVVVAFGEEEVEIDLEKDELLLPPPPPPPPRATTSVWNIIRLQHNRARTHF